MSRTSISSVTRSGMLLIAPGCTRQIARRAPRCRGCRSSIAELLDGQHGFSRRAQGVPAPGHQHGAGVASLSLPGHAECRRRRDRRDDADRSARAVRAAGLARCAARRRRHSGSPEAATSASSPSNPAARRSSSSVLPSESMSAASAAARQAAAERAAAQAADPEPRRLFAREQHDLDRPDRLEPGSRERAHGLERPSTPTVPSNLPESGIASMCEPVATADKSGCWPSQRANVLPIASSRTERPASLKSFLTKARAARSTPE